MVSRSALPALLPDQCVTTAQCSTTPSTHTHAHKHTHPQTHLPHWIIDRISLRNITEILIHCLCGGKKEPQHNHQQWICQLTASSETLPPKKRFYFSGTIWCCSYVFSICWHAWCICFIMTPGCWQWKEITPLSTSWHHVLTPTHYCTVFQYGKPLTSSGSYIRAALHV